MRDLKLSVVIPTLNEESHLENSLRSLLREFDGEVVVADGGSRDGTVSIASRYPVSVLTTEPGVANQCQAAAEITEGDVLLFTAADCELETGWFRELQTVLQSPEVVGGGFTLRFSRQSLPLDIVAWGGNFRSRYLKMALPDQGLFLRRSALEEVGGFDGQSRIPFALMSHQLKRMGEFRILRHASISSPRKYDEHGVLRTAFHHGMTYLKFRYQELPHHW